MLNIHDIMFARNVPVHTATRKWRVLEVTLRVARLGAQSEVYDCLVCGSVGAVSDGATAARSPSRGRVAADAALSTATQLSAADHLLGRRERRSAAD